MSGNLIGPPFAGWLYDYSKEWFLTFGLCGLFIGKITSSYKDIRTQSSFLSRRVAPLDGLAFVELVEAFGILKGKVPRKHGLPEFLLAPLFSALLLSGCVCRAGTYAHT